MAVFLTFDQGTLLNICCSNTTPLLPMLHGYKNSAIQIQCISETVTWKTRVILILNQSLLKANSFIHPCITIILKKKGISKKFKIYFSLILFTEELNP